MGKNKQKDHPEITDIKSICEISPKTKTTKDVCDEVSSHTNTDQKIISKIPAKKK